MNKSFVVALLFFTVTLIRSETPDEKKLRKHIYKNKVELTAENKEQAAKVINNYIEKCKDKLEDNESLFIKMVHPLAISIGVLMIGSGVAQVWWSKGSDGKTLAFMGLYALFQESVFQAERNSNILWLKKRLGRNNQILEKLNSIQK